MIPRYLSLTVLGLIWLPYSLASIVVTLSAILLSPVLALLVKTDGYLPKWLNWYQTPDNPAIGDKMFQDTQMSWTKSNHLKITGSYFV
jgi:hypothetical protein